MTFKNKIYFAIFVVLEFVGLLLVLGYVAAQPLKASDAVGQQVSLPASAPEQYPLTLISVSPVIVEGENVGEVAVYHDPTTKRPADYWELYNSTGDLLAVRWFDRFGIERMAVDRGLLGEAGELEGVFVPLLEGDSI